MPGDIISLTTGQKLPADIRLIESHSLVCSEMALTGESEGVHKDASYVTMPSSMEMQAADDGAADSDGKPAEKKEKSLTSPNMLYMGCSVLDGRGKGIVCKTGMKT